MKIQKFNENVNKNYFYCAVMYDNQVHCSHIFESEDNMDNWILNFVNSELPNQLDWIDDDYAEYGLYKVDDDEYLFLEVNDALNWFNSTVSSGEILYDLNVGIFKNVKLKYDVKKYRDIKKYNV